MNSNFTHYDPYTEAILSIKEKHSFYPGEHKSKIQFIFELKNIYPVWNAQELIIYHIPSVAYIVRGGVITITGEGLDSLWWLFQFDRFGQLIQHGLLTDEQLSSLGGGK